VTAMMEREYGQALEATELLPRTTHYLPEHDALLLLGRLKNKYEPVEFFERRGKEKKAKT